MCLCREVEEVGDDLATGVESCYHEGTGLRVKICWFGGLLLLLLLLLVFPFLRQESEDRFDQVYMLAWHPETVCDDDFVVGYGGFGNWGGFAVFVGVVEC